METMDCIETGTFHRSNLKPHNEACPLNLCHRAKPVQCLTTRACGAQRVCSLAFRMRRGGIMLTHSYSAAITDAVGL